MGNSSIDNEVASLNQATNNFMEVISSARESITIDKGMDKIPKLQKTLLLSTLDYICSNMLNNDSEKNINHIITNYLGPTLATITQTMHGIRNIDMTHNFAEDDVKNCFNDLFTHTNTMRNSLSMINSIQIENIADKQIEKFVMVYLGTMLQKFKEALAPYVDPTLRNDLKNN